jgi:hypothetical protein
MTKILLAVLVYGAFVAGCAAPQASTEPTTERGEVITGSNIPRKRNNLPSEVKSIDGKNLDPALSSPLKTPDTPGMGK